MSEELDTNVDTESDVQSKNEVDTKGESDNQKDSKNTGDKKTEKMLTQAEFDKALRERIAENTKKVKRDIEKSYEGKHVFSEDDLAKLRKDIESEVRTQVALESKRAEYKAKGLTDEQLDAVSVDKPEEYDKRVEALFGALLKKDAPLLRGGSKSNDDSEQPTSFAQKQAQRLNMLKKQHHLK